MLYKQTKSAKDLNNQFRSKPAKSKYRGTGAGTSEKGRL